MKICHLTSAHDSTDVRIFLKECISLASAGYDTYLVAFGDSREENGVHVIGLGKEPEGRLERMTKGAKQVYEAALKLDCEIYHIHDPELLPYGLRLKHHGKKVIFDSHENTLEQMRDKTYIPSVIRPLVAEAYAMYAKSAMKKYDALISVTPHIVDQLREINPKVSMVTNYPICSWSESTCREKSDKFTVCFAGGISEQWSHETIVNCLAEIPDVSYALCGFADEDYLALLQRQPGWNQVDYHGRIKHSEALEILGASHVGMALLKPSRNTGYSEGTLGNIKMFEFMLSGIPMICTDFRLWKDIIERYHCGICVDPEDTKAIAEAIILLKNNPELASEMGRNGRLAVEREFNWTTQEKNLLELYKELRGKEK